MSGNRAIVYTMCSACGLWGNAEQMGFPACGHPIHIGNSRCMEIWLAKEESDNTCPLCRKRIYKSETRKIFLNAKCAKCNTPPVEEIAMDTVITNEEPALEEGVQMEADDANRYLSHCLKEELEETKSLRLRVGELTQRLEDKDNLARAMNEWQDKIMKDMKIVIDEKNVRIEALRYLAHSNMKNYRSVQKSPFETQGPEDDILSDVVFEYTTSEGEVKKVAAGLSIPAILKPPWAEQSHPAARDERTPPLRVQRRTPTVDRFLANPQPTDPTFPALQSFNEVSPTVTGSRTPMTSLATDTAPLFQTARVRIANHRPNAGPRVTKAYEVYDSIDKTIAIVGERTYKEASESLEQDGKEQAFANATRDGEAQRLRREDRTGEGGDDGGEGEGGDEAIREESSDLDGDLEDIASSYAYTDSHQSQRGVDEANY